MELVGKRRGEMVEMTTRSEYTFLTFSIPARGPDRPADPAAERHAGDCVIHHRFEA